jgi:non-reducing end alpha-L-arabinofuranosidase
MHARSLTSVGCLVILGALAVSCSDSTSTGDNGGSSAGGTSAGGYSAGGGTATGGSTMTGSGGTATGGIYSPAGGASSGGITSTASTPTGGLTGTGGFNPVTGGTTSSAGSTFTPTTGGTTGSGGATLAGGATGVGGSTELGGRTGRGGTGVGGRGGSTNVGETGGATTGGTTGAGGGNPTGGTTGAGGGATTGGTTGVGGGGNLGDRPCDIYAAASNPCVAAYSMVRALSKTYTGALYQVRSGSSSQNTGSGGTTHDIGMTADGYADTAAQDAVCNGTTCTVSLLYDQSGNGNNLPVAKKGRSDGGQYGAMDDFESSATKGQVTAGGHKVYSLYMAAREGYRLHAVGKNMPRGSDPEGIYELADGTHVGTACCWDFGNVITDPTQYGVMNTLFFGVAFWGSGAGSGPWFMADFEAGVWAGGTKDGDPGYGALDSNSPPNTNNPSLAVPFAFGILKTDQSKYALRMANVQSASDLTTAFEGGLPKSMNNLGGIVLGVGGDNSNNSWGTFYEGAIVKGYPSTATDLAVMQNVKAVGYTK